MNKINLVFNKCDIYLGGNPYGRRIYNEQVKKRINFDDDKIVIVFPEQVQQLTSSFIQGFFYEIKAKLGLEGIEKKLFIENSGENFKKDIINNLI